MNIPEKLLVNPARVYNILEHHKISLKEAIPVVSAMMEVLEEASQGIETEVEKRLNALAPPGTVPMKFKVSLEVDPTMVASSTVDLETYQRERAARMLATTLLKSTPVIKAPSPGLQMVSDPRRFETWTWEGVIFVKPEVANADSL